MRTFLFLLAGVSLLAASTAAVAGSRAPRTPDEPVPPPLTADQAAASVNAFAVALYGELAGGSGNLFFSPASLQFALGMLAAGARGATAAELAAVCRWPSDLRAIHPGLHDLQQALAPRDPEHVTWSSANRLWGQAGYRLLPEYRALVAQWYAGGYQAVDFRADSEAARRTINAWVADRTNDRIRDLLPAGTVDGDTRLVLTNAVYFLADWDHPFVPRHTRDDPFHLAGGGTVTVPLMQTIERYPYTAIGMLDRRVQLLELPYGGGDYAMDVLLPATADGLPALEQQLTPQRLAEWLASLRTRRVHCYLPKFSMQRRFFLHDTLAAMGMQTAFSGRADFSGITGRPDLSVSDVIHQAFLKVDETGTEAAAATGITLKATSVRPVEKPVEFRADHPFLLLIRHRPTGAILFMGRVMDPTANGAG